MLSESSRRLLLLLSLGATSLGCAGKPAEAPVSRKQPPTKVANEASVESYATLIGRIPEGTLGPKRFVGDDVDLVLWAVPSGDEAGLWARDLRHGARNERLAEVPPGLRHFSAELVGKRLLFTFGHRADKTEFLSLWELDGSAPSLPSRIGNIESPNPIVWSQIESSKDGELLVWAERSVKGVELSVARLVHGEDVLPRRLVRGVVSWQLGRALGKPMLVTIEGDKGKRNLVARALNDDGTLAQRERVVEEKVDVSDEIEVMNLGSGIAILLTQKGSSTTRISIATLDAKLEVSKKLTPLTKPRGEQRLLGVRESRDGKQRIVLWEEPEHGSVGTRRLLLGRLRTDGTLEEPLADFALPLESARLPEFSIGDDGVVHFLGESLASEGAPARTFVLGRSRLAPDEPGTAEKLSLPTGAIGLAWNFASQGEEETGLLASAETSPLVYAFRGRAGLEGHDSPLKVLEREPLPRVLTEQAVVDVPELSRLRALPGPQIAWISYFDPSIPPSVKEPKAPDGRPAPMRAWVKVQRLALSERTGELTVQGESVISYRARSLGGLAVLPRNGGELLGWSAIDGAHPGLFLTLLDENGRKVEQRMLRHGPGEITDIALSRVSGGYLVCWVDARGAAPDLYAQLVDEKLKPLGAEVRLSEGLVDPADVTLWAQDQTVLVAYADKRSADGSSADLFIVPIGASSGERLAFPRRVQPTPEHSFSPIWVPREGGSASDLFWLEGSASGDTPSRAMRVSVDGLGRLLEEPVALPIPGAVRSFDVERNGKQLRVVYLVEREGRGELWGQVLSSEGRAESPPQRLTVLEGAASQTVAPALAGDFAFFFEQSGSGGKALRALRLAFE